MPKPTKTIRSQPKMKETYEIIALDDFGRLRLGYFIVLSYRKSRFEHAGSAALAPRERPVSPIANGYARYRKRLGAQLTAL